MKKRAHFVFFICMFFIAACSHTNRLYVERYADFTEKPDLDCIKEAANAVLDKQLYVVEKTSQNFKARYTTKQFIHVSISSGSLKNGKYYWKQAYDRPIYLPSDYISKLNYGLRRMERSVSKKCILNLEENIKENTRYFHVDYLGYI